MLRSSITTNENAPSSVGRTSTNADSRSSEVPGEDGGDQVGVRRGGACGPTRPASSSVFTRFPLCPSARDRCPSVLNAGWAFSHVVEPVVE